MTSNFQVKQVVGMTKLASQLPVCRLKGSWRETMISYGQKCLQVTTTHNNDK